MSEHTVNKDIFDAEMIVHHKGDDGTLADVSFLLQISVEADANEFLENLAPYMWSVDISDGP